VAGTHERRARHWRGIHAKLVTRIVPPPEARRDSKEFGQAVEFAVWRELIQQSHGALHVFLPLLDNGFDGVVHRLTDGAYLPIQIKGRSSLVRGQVQLFVNRNALVDDRGVIIAGLLTDEGLGPSLLVIDEGTFKKLATPVIVGEIHALEAHFSIRPTAASRWRSYVIPREQLAAQILGRPVADTRAETGAFEADFGPVDRYTGWLGFLGEVEVVRRLAESPQLDLFRPFPDIELVEVLARNNSTGRFVGLQVKTGVPGHEGEAELHVRKSTFVASESSYIVGLAWLPTIGRFADECLVIPTRRLESVAIDGGDLLVLLFHPESPKPTVLDPYRRPLSALGALVVGLTEAS
jgi:hypothetical protein